jgi:DNA repair protein RadC
VDPAERLLTKFGNLHAVFSAGQEELLEVPDLGKRTVERFIEILKK